MTNDTKALIIEAIELKEASIKRAMNGAKPAFKELYQKDLTLCNQAKIDIGELK